MLIFHTLGARLGYTLCLNQRRRRNGGKYFHNQIVLSRVMKKPDFCLCENKGTDQLCSNCKAGQRLCFRCMDSTILPLLISKISSFQPSSVTVQTSLCHTLSETPKTAVLTAWLKYEGCEERSLDPLLRIRQATIQAIGPSYRKHYSVQVSLNNNHNMSRLMEKPTMWFLNRSDTN